jgi:hypothetical protein
MNNWPYDSNFPQFPYYPLPEKPKSLGASYSDLVASLQPPPSQFSLADLARDKNLIRNPHEIKKQNG